MMEYIPDRFGRRPVILCASVVFLVGAIVMGAAPEKVTLLVGRIIVGIGIGRTLIYCQTFHMILSKLTLLLPLVIGITFLDTSTPLQALHQWLYLCI